MNFFFACLVLFLLSPLAARAQGMGTLTFREGSLSVIRGTRMLQGAEGMRLQAGDILESSEPGFAQIEFAGGAILALGPSTQVLLLSHSASRFGSGDRPTGEFVLLTGWLKGEIASTLGAYRCATPLLAVTTKRGAVLLHANARTAEAFLESGSGNVSQVTAEGSLGSSVTAQPGQFLWRRSGKNISSSPRPDPAFVQSMPTAFRDTLPSRLSRFSGKPVEPKPDHEVSYREIESWLSIAPAWRRGFVERFQPRLKDPEFREAVDAHLARHPEWDPILHPEKYPPGTPPATAGSSVPRER
jgi:hypothetical protein